MIDAYSIAFGIALFCTLVIARWLGGCARAKGSLLLVASWLCVMSFQRATGDYSFPLLFAALDLVWVIAFGVIALLYNRTWAWYVSGFHVAMLFTHATYLMVPQASAYVYLTVLAGLGYASMLAIAGPPLYLKLTGRADGAVDYPDFMRGRSLPASAFPPEGQGKEAQE